MLWSPSSFEGEGKRGVHRTYHQFQQLLLRSFSADDAAHARIDILTCSSAETWNIPEFLGTGEVIEG